MRDTLHLALCSRAATKPQFAEVSNPARAAYVRTVCVDARPRSNFSGQNEGFRLMVEKFRVDEGFHPAFMVRFPL
jgi:hypothetical protein